MKYIYNKSTKKFSIATETFSKAKRVGLIDLSNPELESWYKGDNYRNDEYVPASKLSHIKTVTDNWKDAQAWVKEWEKKDGKRYGFVVEVKPGKFDADI